MKAGRPLGRPALFFRWIHPLSVSVQRLIPAPAMLAIAVAASRISFSP
jgi:hypothetical protein